MRDFSLYVFEKNFIRIESLLTCMYIFKGFYRLDCVRERKLFFLVTYLSGDFLFNGVKNVRIELTEFDV